jgi:hypothetical protein
VTTLLCEVSIISIGKSFGFFLPAVSIISIGKSFIERSDYTRDLLHNLYANAGKKNKAFAYHY